MDENIYKVIFAAFVVLLVFVRMPSRMRYKKTKKVFLKRSRNEKSLVVLAFFGMLGFPFIYIFTDWFDYFRMSLPPWARLSALPISLLALIFLWWVHKTLGRNWSPLAEIIEKHQLVCKGPYKYIRHPMYTAFYLFSAGLWLLFSNWFIGLFAFLSWHILASARIKTEEEMLIKKFGREYTEYMSKTGRLFPKLNNRLRRKNETV